MASQLDKEEATLHQARLSLIAAKDDFKAISELVKENTNEYADEKFEKVTHAGRQVQMPSSKQWYEFWEKASRIPKDLKYETCTGQKFVYTKIVSQNMGLLQSLSTEEYFQPAGTRSGITFESLDDVRVNGNVKTYRASLTINVPPRVLLLTQIHAPSIGSSDDGLVYMREHYNFIGGKTSLVHSVRKISSLGTINLREFFELTNWTEEEDGSIFFTSQSVKVLPESVPGAVKADNMFYGVVMKPATAVVGAFLGGLGGKQIEATEVTFVSQQRLNGWLPGFVCDFLAPRSLASRIQSSKKAALDILADDTKKEKLVRKFVDRELDHETE